MPWMGQKITSVLGPHGKEGRSGAFFIRDTSAPGKGNDDSFHDLRFTMISECFSDARDGFLQGTSSPRDLLEHYLQRISEREPEIRAFTHVDVELARAAADASTSRYRAGRPISAVDGLPIGLKDILETEDMPTGFGSPIYKGWRGGRDSAIAAALRAAGAVIVGKLTSTEFAATVVTADTRNPLDLSRTPGGSSSGSAAAVAAGMLPVALGTQVVGSGIRPASFCGIFGFKPTYGSLNRGGSLDNYSQNVIGTLSANLSDAWAVCHEASRLVGGDPGCLPFQGGPRPAPPHKPQTIAVLETAGWKDVGDHTKSEFDKFLNRAAADGIAIFDRSASKLVERLERAIVPARELSATICAYEAVWPYAEIQKQHGSKLSKQMRERVEMGQAISADEYADALVQREEMTNALLAFAGSVDAFVTLSATGPAPVGLQSSGDPVFAVPFTVMRVPVISLPLLKVEGLPVGVQVAGFPNRDRALSGASEYLMRL